MTYLETMRQLLLNYPILWDCPLSVSIHLFTRPGNAFEWDEVGNLSYIFPREPRTEPLFLDTKETDSLERKLQNAAYRWKYQYIVDNIDDILACPCTLDIFEKRPKIKDISSPQYIQAFNFPDNIQRDWGLTLIDFLIFWKGEKDAPLQDEVHKALIRLYNIIHCEDYDEVFRQQTELAQQIIDEILVERTK